jgi:hypothetical protein
MCTVSVIAAGLPGLRTVGLRVVCNRDESRDRTAALPPAWRTLDSQSPARAIWPIDPDAGGTWIAASDRGLVLSLLNLNPCPSVGPTAVSPAARGLVSRGLIIPELIHAADAAGAMEALRRIDLRDFAAFRLVAFQLSGDAPDAQPESVEASWDRTQLRITPRTPGAACFTSSGLGDHLVTSRLGLFDEMVRAAPSRDAQDRYHRHVWPDRPHLSVMMSREDARTVSVTTVEVARSGARTVVDMRYREASDADGLHQRPLGNWAEARPPHRPQ